MAAVAAMRSSFERCGFNNATATFIMDEGFNTPFQLNLVTSSDLKDLVRNASRALPENVKFPFMAVKKLMAYRFWVAERIRTGQDIEPASFTDDECTRALKNLCDNDERVEADKNLDVCKADPLKSTVGWVKFHEKFVNYLTQLRGRALAPLTYLLRSEEVVTAAMRTQVYETVDDRLISTTLLNGDHFVHDNKRLWKELKFLTCDGTGWPFIKRYDKSENGRAAYLTLKSQCEGASAVLTQKVKAYNMIENAKYTGERKSFTFVDYITAHQEGYNLIIDADPNEVIPESKRVRDFLAGIRDPNLRNSIDIVLGNEAMLSSFQETQNFLNKIVINRKHHDASQKENRSIAAIVTRKLEDRFYSKDEWAKLTSEERTEVQKMAATRKLKKKNKKRKVSAIRRKNESKKSKRDSESDEEVPMKNDNAGDQFGRKVHKKADK